MNQSGSREHPGSSRLDLAEAEADAPAGVHSQAVAFGYLAGVAHAVAQAALGVDERAGERPVRQRHAAVDAPGAEEVAEARAPSDKIDLPDYVRQRMRPGFYVSLDGEEIRDDGRRWPLHPARSAG